jgi:ankyrin repeat protein
MIKKMSLAKYLSKDIDLRYEDIKKVVSSGKNKIKLVQILNKNNNHHMIVNLIHDSIIKNDMAVFKFLINNGIKDMNVGNVNRVCPIHIAAQHNNIEVIQILIKKGANINNTDNAFLIAPIHVAINRSNFDAVEELIKHGADINIMANISESIDSEVKKRMCSRCKQMCACKKMCTPLQYAIRANSYKIVQLLLDHGAIIHNYKNIYDNELFIGLFSNEQDSNNTEIIKALIKSGAELNILSDCGMSTPLYQAVFNNNLEVVNLLIEYGADVNMTKRYNECPLSNAAQFGYLPIVRTLINHGANVNNLESRLETSPLYLATQNNHLDVVIELVKAGANISQSNKEHRRPILIAMHKRNYLIVNYLLSCGESLGTCNISPHIKILKELKKCSYVDCTNKRESTCSACTVQGYCSRECQKLDWPIHKNVCKLLKTV